MNGENRTVNFNPSQDFYAKNSLGLDGYITLPKLKMGEKNNTLQTIFEKSLTQQKERSKRVEEYQAIIDTFENILDKCTNVVGINKALLWTKEMSHVLTSKNTTWSMLKAKADGLSLTFDKTNVTFIETLEKKKEDK